MNNAVFYSIFGLSDDQSVASIALFLSHYMTYILIGVILVSIFYKNKSFFLKLFVVGGAGATAFVVSKFLKIILQIPRPFNTLDLVPLVVETGYSMPSSHATVFSALATVAFGINRDLGIGFSLFALLIGVSRIVLGVHYPSDILVGFALGIFIGLVFLALGKSNFVQQFLDKYLSKFEAKLVK